VDAWVTYSEGRKDGRLAGQLGRVLGVVAVNFRALHDGATCSCIFHLGACHAAKQGGESMVWRVERAMRRVRSQKVCPRRRRRRDSRFDQIRLDDLR